MTSLGSRRRFWIASCAISPSTATGRSAPRSSAVADDGETAPDVDDEPAEASWLLIDDRIDWRCWSVMVMPRRAASSDQMRKVVKALSIAAVSDVGYDDGVVPAVEALAPLKLWSNCWATTGLVDTLANVSRKSDWDSVHVP